MLVAFAEVLNNDKTASTRIQATSKNPDNLNHSWAPNRPGRFRLASGLDCSNAEDNLAIVRTVAVSQGESIKRLREMGTDSHKTPNLRWLRDYDDALTYCFQSHCVARADYECLVFHHRFPRVGFGPLESICRRPSTWECISYHWNAQELHADAEVRSICQSASGRERTNRSAAGQY